MDGTEPRCAESSITVEEGTAAGDDATLGSRPIPMTVRLSRCAWVRWESGTRRDAAWQSCHPSPKEG